MEKIKQLIKLFALVLITLGSTNAMGQSTISGSVKDQTGETLPGVSILLKGTTQGAVSDFDGNYKISNVADGTYKLVASYIGFDSFSKVIIVDGSNIALNIVLVENAESLDEIIITGVTNPKSKIESSVSVTTMRPETIKQSAPRTTAEIFRTIPGIRSESSGGEGNSNIAVRGVPISSGGSKYVQLQEDGLPVLLFGDMSFATADIFTRFDSNIAKIEAIRGGSASTLSTNSPGAIINLISKTGKTEGGSLGSTFGLDFNSFKTDFEYGSPIGENLYFHIGGFYRAGEGIRDVGFTANNGGQLKFNLTKEFDKGYVRVYGKYLNDRAIAYLPMPIQVTGTNENPTWSSIPGFDATDGSNHTPFLSQNVGLGPDGQLRRSSVADGMRPESVSLGLEASFELTDGWKIKNNGRFSSNKGRFVSPFPSQVASATDILSSDANWGSLTYANDGTAVPGNVLVTRIHMFDTELNNFNNFMNDFKLTKSFDKVNLTLGYFKSLQNVSMSWLWNSYLQESVGKNARLINVQDNTGGSLSENGLYAYGVPFWGNCCTRNYDTQYNISAPYANLSIEASENFNIDASIRYDKGKVDGSFAGTVQTIFDINNDGTISAPEQSVSAVDNANVTTVDYDYDYVSYSLGFNYKIEDRQAVFARFSKGAAAKADRILFSGLDYLDGDRINALDFISQGELGYKRGFEKGTLYATLFYAKTSEEGGFEATSNSIIENDYKSIGVELEGTYNIKNFNLRGGITYTNAKIDSGTNDGNTPRRQPDFMYNLIPTYTFGSNLQNSIGLSFIGQSKAYAQDSNELIMPGFVIVNSNLGIGITKNFAANLSINNLFDSLGITESEEGSITSGQVSYVRARPVPGRSISLGLNYRF
ncbi:TonB-dependent receptor [Flavobacteriaceae bacterium S356]|uniref:TonB-dependent receptor n=1 Tax=Asprobacillus argus TaxID=3076534 RepID=A0ABU3LCM3_9FLAO|nr:TonB-dependent receptor [Flavobacteriaceae bacterium S356]